jgi:hypothetical protein
VQSGIREQRVLGYCSALANANRGSRIPREQLAEAAPVNRFAAAVPVPVKARVSVRVTRPLKDSSKGVVIVAAL